MLLFLMTHCPASPIALHVTVDLQGGDGPPREDGVHPTGLGWIVVMEIRAVNWQQQKRAARSTKEKGHHK